MLRRSSLAVVGLIVVAGSACSSSHPRPQSICTPLPLLGIVSYPDGGKDYVYPGGRAQSVAPSRLNPLTATDAQLNHYGFPPRPRDAEQLAAWSADFSRFKGSVKPGLCASGRRNG